MDKSVLSTNHCCKEVLNQRLQQVRQDISTLIRNSDQLPNQINELKCLINANDYDAILLTEVCPMKSGNQLLGSHVSLQGYNTLSNLLSKYCHCHGTLALVKSSYSITPIDYFTGCPHAKKISLIF